MFLQDSTQKCAAFRDYSAILGLFNTILYSHIILQTKTFWNPSWWFFPTHLKNMLKMGSSSPRIGMKIKNIYAMVKSRGVFIGDGKPPTFNDGVLISWGPINPYRIGLTTIPYYMEIMGVDRPDRTFELPPPRISFFIPRLWRRCARYIPVVSWRS